MNNLLQNFRKLTHCNKILTAWYTVYLTRHQAFSWERLSEMSERMEHFVITAAWFGWLHCLAVTLTSANQLLRPHPPPPSSPAARSTW